MDGEEEKGEFVDSKQQAITVELVGAEKAYQVQSQLGSLRSICVPGAAVRNAADVSTLGEKFQNASELDISRTLFKDWTSVGTVLVQLPKLTMLRVCGMAFPAVSPAEIERAEEARGAAGGGATLPVVPGVTELFFNLCPQSFDAGRGPPQIVTIISMFPHVTELHLGGNELRTLSEEGGQCLFPKTLEHLNIEDNKISDWSEVLSLGDLPNLARLNVSKNSLVELHSLESGRRFPALVALNVSRNDLTGWQSVNQLAGLPALAEIVIGHNPVFDSERGLHARQCIIGRVRQAQRVNRTVVEPQERVVAERFYLTRYSAEWWKAKEEGEAALGLFAAAYPTFQELMAKHGEPDRPKSDVVALKAGFVRLTAVDRGGMALKPMQLPATTKIARLRQVLKAKKVLCLDNLLSAGLLYVDDDANVHDILLDDDMRDLIFYGVKSGELRVVSTQ